MAKKKDTYVAGQTLHERIEVDEFGNQIRTQKVIYEQREFVDGYQDVRLPKKHKYNNGGFITVFQQALLTIVEQGKLSKTEMAMLLWLLGTTGIDGSVRTNLDEMSEILGVAKSLVSKSLKGLVQRNIVIREDGNRYDRQPLPMNLSFNYDQINYNLAYNGKTSTFKRKKTEHPALAIPGNQPGEWIDTQTGEYTVEQGGKLVQVSIPFETKNYNDGNNE